MKKKGISILLVATLLLTSNFLAGCSSGTAGSYGGETVQLSAADGMASDLGDGFCFVGEEEGLTDFSVKVFQESLKNSESGENAMISPLSLMTALAMTARGAEGETRAQIEEALGSDLDYFTAYLGTFLKSLTGREAKFTSVNSIWIRDEADRLTVSDQFLVDAEEYFDADVFLAAFDRGTVKDINRWCSEKTDGMVDEIMKEIQDDEVIHLINAICFDAKWQNPYESYNVRKGEFSNASGGTDKAEYMYGEEFVYLEDEVVTGFMKAYKGGFSFVALLPKDGAGDGTASALAVSNYVETMTGTALRSLLNTATEIPVHTRIPKFSSEYSLNLIPALEAMGIADLFDADLADLSGMATSTNGNIFISKVFQKTFIEVDTEGTRAAAVTDIAASDGAALEMEYREVYLDRPFIYMILDDETGVPLFMGIVTEL